MEETEVPVLRPMSTPSKASRSFSDPEPPTNNTNTTLAPSPEFKERNRSRDDHALPQPTTPRASRRPELLSRGLTLQLPPARVNTDAPSASHLAATPLSPKLDAHNIYNQSPNLSHSPATSLPRHSRGLDFSRACTTLHHSTIAESSPDSSPVITQRAMAIPSRRVSMSSNMALDSPNVNGPSSMPWGMPGMDKSGMSSSVGSVNMAMSESDSTDSDDDASMGGDEDPMFTTPQVHKLHNPSAPTPFNAPSTPSGNTWGTGSHFSPAQTSLMKTIRRTRLHKNGKRSRKSSSSASGSGYSSLASPRTTSPPPLRSIETAASHGGGGYFTWSNAARSRRESLAMGTDGLQLSSGNDSGDEASLTAPSTPGVVRRPVTRRGNLLPKTKGFARIRAALLEESAPVDTETRREAETIRQVRERDNSAGELDLERPQTATAASSPNLLPAVPESAQEDFGREFESDPLGSRGLGLGTNFAAHASRNSGGLDYWNRFDPSMRTPPPPSFARQSSSVMSDIDSPMGDFTLWRRPRARSSASDASEAFQPNSSNAVPAGISDDVHLKKFKRRREDDFDIGTIKRRAVSPGMSTQNSPVLTQSPSANANSGWGQPPEKKENGSESSSQQPRSGSGGSASGMISGVNMVNQGKKLGLQPMTDTNDGLMKMHL